MVFKKNSCTSPTRLGRNQAKLSEKENEIDFLTSICHIQNRQAANSSFYYHKKNIHDSGAHHTEINVLQTSNFKEIHSKIVVDVQSVVPNCDAAIKLKLNRHFPTKSSDSMEINDTKTGFEETMLQSRAYGNFNQYPPHSKKNVPYFSLIY